MLERKQGNAQCQKVAWLFYFQSQHAFDAKESSISGGDKAKGGICPLPGPCSALGSVKLHCFHLEGRSPSQRGSTHESLPAYAVQTLLGCSLDLGDVTGSWVLQVSCSWRDSTRNWSSGLRLSFKLRGRQKANIWEKTGNKRLKWLKADFLCTKCHTDIILAGM